MEISRFKAGTWQQQYQYKSFNPTLINTDWVVDNGVLNKLLSEANIRLGELNAFSMLVPDVDYFIKMHVQKEATKSSRIEGTQTNIEDSLQKKENIKPEKRNDWIEVHNYVSAMNASIQELNKLPFSIRLLKRAHEILMTSVRGADKTPGEFRISQNWIGGSSIKDAVFIPPHQDSIIEQMSDLEKFLHNENSSTPDLIKIGIAHYQFETIHPFLDGNGRIGRLMITLYLVQKEILVKPTLYLSDFFEKNKSLYYDNLMIARSNNNLTQWLKFFLEGVKQTSENSIQTFKKIISLREGLDTQVIPTLGKRTKLAQALLKYLYTQPITESGDIAKALDTSISTANRLINDFIRLDILLEATGFKRNRFFVFYKYVDLFN